MSEPITKIASKNKGTIIALALIAASILVYVYFTKPKAQTPTPEPEPKKMTQEEADILAGQTIGSGRLGLSTEAKAKNEEIKTKLQAEGYKLSCSGSIDTNTYKCVAVKV
jgi:hypothetical protein